MLAMVREIHCDSDDYYNGGLISEALIIGYLQVSIYSIQVYMTAATQGFGIFLTASKLVQLQKLCLANLQLQVLQQKNYPYLILMTLQIIENSLKCKVKWWIIKNCTGICQKDNQNAEVNRMIFLVGNLLRSQHCPGNIVIIVRNK